MELLLKEDVPGLGARGEIVTVARGYARNYLLPKGMAEVPTPEAIRIVRKKAEAHAKVMAAEKADKVELAQKLAAVALTIPMKASEEGHLYGSVGPRQVIESLSAEGFEFEEKAVQLDAHLKEVGEYDVVLSLHPEVQVPIKVTVAAEED
jgi:large subunit ribosomal protein L9